MTEQVSKPRIEEIIETNFDAVNLADNLTELMRKTGQKLKVTIEYDSHSNFPKEIPAAKSCEPCEPCRYIDEESETPCTQRGINLILKSAEWAKRQKEIPAATPDSSIRISELEKILESRMDEIGELYDKIRQQKQQLKAATLDVNAVLDELLPKSTGENKEGGWMYPLKFLSALEFIIEERGFYSFQCEDIEEILIAFETYCRQNAKQEGDVK